MKVKFVDLHAMHAPLMDEFQRHRAIAHGDAVFGAQVPGECLP